MAKYIDRDKLIDDIQAAMTLDGLGLTVGGTMLRYIKRADAADVAPVVHGVWIYNTNDFTPKKRCSHCGYNKPIAAGEHIKSEPENYCPNCGARMDGGADHAGD